MNIPIQLDKNADNKIEITEIFEFAKDLLGILCDTFKKVNPFTGGSWAKFVITLVGNLWTWAFKNDTAINSKIDNTELANACTGDACGLDAVKTLVEEVRSNG